MEIDPKVELTEHDLPAPTPQRAEFYLRELEWEGRFVGIELNPSSGPHECYVFSLKEAIRFLRFGTSGVGLSKSGKGSISFFDGSKLIAWIRDHVQDLDLADALEASIKDETIPYREIKASQTVLEKRYAQLLGIIESAKEERDDQQDNEQEATVLEL